jgi:hypothetical protein
MSHKWLIAGGLLLALACPARAHETEAPRRRQLGYVEMKNAQVMHAFLVLESVRPPDRNDGFALARERDELLLPAGRGPEGRAGGYGAAMLGAAVVMAAHAPAPLRPLFDAQVHLGPAVFEGGGMGAGLGGTF